MGINNRMKNDTSYTNIYAHMHYSKPLIMQYVVNMQNLQK